MKFPDPVKHCPVFKESGSGCVHVDGPLCDYPLCSCLETWKAAILKNPKPSPRTIAFDFDNVIHLYRKGWYDGSIYDKLNPDILNQIAVLLSAGHFVIILTTRSRKQIRKYFDSFRVRVDGQTWVGNEPGMDLSYWENKVIPFKYKTFGPRKKFWNIKGVVGICNHKAVFDVLVDDRAVTFVPGIGVSNEDLIAFRPKPYPND